MSENVTIAKWPLLFLCGAVLLNAAVDAARFAERMLNDDALAVCIGERKTACVVDGVRWTITYKSPVDTERGR